MAQPKVFVSHSHMDDAFAERLVKDLKAAGADAWLDNEDVGAGDFQERISEALDKAEWFVLVLTRNALSSKWVRQEVHAANSLKQSGRIRDLVFMQAGPLEHDELPALWRVYNIFDATKDYTAARDRMLRAVGITGHEAIAPLVSGIPSQPNQKIFRQYQRFGVLDEFCGRCGTANKPFFAKCAKCGAPRPAVEFSEALATLLPSSRCVRCGKPNSPVDTFCTACGEVLPRLAP